MPNTSQRPYGGRYDNLITSNEEARAVYLTGVEDGYQQGLDAGYRAALHDYAARYRKAVAQATDCPHVHPVIQESVQSMFAHWQGIDAARADSVARIKSQQGVNQ